MESIISSQSIDNDKIEYTVPVLQELEVPKGFVIRGDSNIVDDEDHEYDPDND